MVVTGAAFHDPRRTALVEQETSVAERVPTAA